MAVRNPLTGLRSLVSSNRALGREAERREEQSKEEADTRDAKALARLFVSTFNKQDTEALPARLPDGLR
jgi:hypothetical protein